MKTWKVSMRNDAHPILTFTYRIPAKTLLHAMMMAGKLRKLHYSGYSILNIERVI